ncbi:GTPase IMAP family member 6 [Triplophysa tibetana]|uniref:GTPase IMAP family member 6 n=1 Tax=Triplophysa tibetana TaxID=1572043 RepID=A0A5A9P5T1_9TELE|nr:GTPase IMAP family member 6 [Triplophysa tibetana]
MEEWSMKQPQLTSNRPSQDSLRFGNKYYIIQTGNSRDTPREILKHLHKRIPGLKEVYSVNDCDVILVFCPIVSRAGTDMENALNKLNQCSASKPAVFMVLHHTYEREKIVPDSSRFVSRENTLTVNFLFNEDNGLLKCAMNEKALIKIIEHLEPQILWQKVKIFLLFIISTLANKVRGTSTEQHSMQNALMIKFRSNLTIDMQPECQQRGGASSFNMMIPKDELCTIAGNKYYIHIAGNTFRAHHVHIRNVLQQITGLDEVTSVDKCDIILVICTVVSSAGTDIKAALNALNKLSGNKYFIIQTGNSPREILKHLHKSKPGLKEVCSVDECDVILVFCPIVSRAGTDMEAALNKLNQCSASKPAVFMVLHHTYEREKIVPDSSRFVSRENTLTVNFLFNEDIGLLECATNDEALIKIIEHFEPQTYAFRLQALRYGGTSRLPYHCGCPNTGEYKSGDGDEKKESKKWLAYPKGRVHRKFNHSLVAKTEPFGNTGNSEIASTELSRNIVISATTSVAVTESIESSEIQATTPWKKQKEEDKTKVKDFVFFLEESAQQIGTRIKMSQQPDTCGNQRAADQSSTDKKDSGLADPNSQPSKIGGNKYHIILCGKTLKCHEEIINHLQTLGLKEVSVEECDVIVVLCSVVSRAGTDIEAALKILNGLSGQTGLTVASELMIVLLGMSGSEKTAVGKMILGRKEMCDATISTVTQKITVEIGTVDKGQVYVIDTPDWFNSDLPLERMKKNIHDCIRMCSCKPYAVLLVIPGKQITEEQKEIESMKKFFEEICWERVMVLFTVTDEQEKQNIEAIIQKNNVHDIENRLYSLNIAQTGNSAQVSELLKKIEDMIAGTKESSVLTELEIKTAIAQINQESMERNLNYSKIQLPELQHTIWVSKESQVFQFEDMTDDSFVKITKLSF